jgi:hypothetical protein
VACPTREHPTGHLEPEGAEPSGDEIGGIVAELQGAGRLHRGRCAAGEPEYEALRTAQGDLILAIGTGEFVEQPFRLFRRWG